MTKMATWLLMGALGLGIGGGRALAADPDTDTDDTNAPTNTDTSRANRASDTGSSDEARSSKGTKTTDTEIQMSDLPGAVRDTFKREAKGGKVEELRKQTQKDGSVVYEGEIVKKGKGREIEVNSDGMVVDRGKAHNEKMEQHHGGQQ